MLKSIWNWIVGEVHTVESILSDFTNKVKQLEHHAEQKLIEVTDLHSEFAAMDAEYVKIKHQLESDFQTTKADIEGEVAAAQAEADKATAAAEKIKNIVVG